MKTQPKWLSLSRFTGSFEEADYILGRWHASSLDEYEVQKKHLHDLNPVVVNAALDSIILAGYQASGFSSLALVMLRREPKGKAWLAKAHIVELIIACARDYAFSSFLERHLKAISEHDAIIAWC